MSENPLQALFQTFEKVSRSVQTHLSNLIGQPHHPSPTSKKPILSLSYPSKVNPSSTDSAAPLQPNDILNKGKSAASPVTKEELGRATWTFLHTLAAQYPDNPTRQQKKDVKELMAILSRMYPCKECADHFKEVLRANPVQAGSHAEFSQWLCHVHNVVNRRDVEQLELVQRWSDELTEESFSDAYITPNRTYTDSFLGKVKFPCERVDARWGKLECEQRECDILGSTTEF